MLDNVIMRKTLVRAFFFFFFLVGLGFGERLVCLWGGFFLLLYIYVEFF